jgi:hypothetical protein
MGLKKKVDGYMSEDICGTESVVVVFNDRKTARCCTLVVHEGSHERVFTESEVNALLGEIKRADLFVDSLEDAAKRIGLSLNYVQYGS